MALTAKEILDGFEAPTAPATSVIDADELRRSVIEDQVAELRQRTAKGEKPPVLPSKAPNPRQEAITSQKAPRLVGLPPGMLETGLEGIGAGAGAQQGAMRGAAYGARFGLPGAAAGGLLGSLAGAGLGLAGTRSGVEGGKAAMGLRPPVTADEAIASGRRALMEGVAGEGAFRLFKAIPTGYHGLKQRLLAGEIQPAERALYEQAQEMGIHLTPSTLTDSKAPKMVESTLRRTLAGSGKFTANDIQNEVNLRKGVEQWADQTMGQYIDKEQTGVILKKALNDEVIPEHQQFVKALYSRLDEQTGGAKIVETNDLYKHLVDIRASLARRGDTHASAMSAIDDVIQRISKKGNVTGLTVERGTEPITSMVPGKSKVKIKKDVTQPSLLSPQQGTKPYDTGFVTPEETQLTGIKTNTTWQRIQTGEKLTGLKVTEKSDAPRQPIPLTFAEAQEIRSIIGREVGSGGPPLPGNETKKLKEAYALMTEKMGGAAMDFTKATGKDINLSWALADTMNKRGHALFNESVVAKVVEKDPALVVQTVFKKDAIQPTKDLIRALETKPEILGVYRRGVVEQLMEESLDKPTGRIVGTDFAKAARKRGDLMLKHTFGENYDGFKQILEIAERMPKQKDSGMLWFEQGLYISGMMGALTGHALESSGTVAAATAMPAGWFIGTKRLASILTDKEATNKLLSLRTLSPKTEAYARTIMQLGGIEVGETGQPMAGTTEPRRGLLTGITQTLME